MKNPLLKPCLFCFILLMSSFANADLITVEFEHINANDDFGIFTGSDLDNDGLIQIGEMTEFLWLWGAPLKVDLTTLIAFGEYDIARNIVIQDPQGFSFIPSQGTTMVFSATNAINILAVTTHDVPEPVPLGVLAFSVIALILSRKKSSQCKP
ncbi:hypothetical protein KO519_16170 [Paraglaciecola agarilytica]|uniref:hypothetical protein n=1 Tax=Paraglaciecola chathamensis TaxID=368405 RepID=UPI001C086252|nr:hypothetical protein [Paraglaciecola agarilytica]MBU3019217.1 hypothetical protein [Paraglaciecola agarilytica]